MSQCTILDGNVRRTLDLNPSARRPSGVLMEPPDWMRNGVYPAMFDGTKGNLHVLEKRVKGRTAGFLDLMRNPMQPYRGPMPRRPHGELIYECRVRFVKDDV